MQPLDAILLRVTLLQQEVAKIHKDPSSYGISPSILFKDSGKDFTTAVDLHIEHLVKERLHHILPESGFIGEETASIAGQRYHWLLDPTDGTAVYSLGGDYYSNVIALIDKEEEKILLSSVYQSATGRQFRRLDNFMTVDEPTTFAYFPGEEKSSTIRRLPRQTTSKCSGEWLGCALISQKYHASYPELKKRLDGLFLPGEPSPTGRIYPLKDARPASGSSALFASDIADGKRHFLLAFYQHAWDLVGAAYAHAIGRPVIVFDDNGKPTDRDLEREIVHAHKNTLLHIGVFGNDYIKDDVLRRFTADISL